MIQQPMENISNNQNADSDFLLYWNNVNLIDILDENEKRLYKEYHGPKCYHKGIIGNIIYYIIYISINIAFVISALVLEINNHKGYKNYRDSIKLNPLSNYEKFWCSFGKYENGILLSYSILLILALVFEIISLLILKNIIKIEIEKISNSNFNKLFIVYIFLGLFHFFSIFNISFICCSVQNTIKS